MPWRHVLNTVLDYIRNTDEHPVHRATNILDILDSWIDVELKSWDCSFQSIYVSLEDEVFLITDNWNFISNNLRGY